MAGVFAPAATGFAAGKKRSETPVKPIKRAVRLDAVSTTGNRYIELPDPREPLRYYGANVYLELVDRMQRTGEFAIVVDPNVEQSQGIGVEIGTVSSALMVSPDPCLMRVAPVPSSQISIQVDELVFSVGSRAERMTYGFFRNATNPFNEGIDAANRNEYPIRPANEPASWFAGAFEDSGGLHTGLDLGHEINFDLFWVGAKLRHVEYYASLGLDIRFQNRFGASEHRQITAKGRGFYFDVGAHYNLNGIDLSAGVTIARKAALLDVFNRVVKSATQAIGDQVSQMPLMTRLAGQCAGDFYLGVGADYRVSPGQRFYDLTQLNSGQRPTIFTVEQVYQRGSKVQVDGSGFSLDDELVSLNAGEDVPLAVARQGLGLSASGGSFSQMLIRETKQSLDAGSKDLDPPKELANFVESAITRFFKGLKELFTLPYRISRYFQYDQKFGGGELWQVGLDQAVRLASKSWALRAIGAPEAWKKKSSLGARAVIVAVIDSGIDYNHRELRRNIYWDGARGFAGWDFMSSDSRPYDDHAHGTGIASVIAGGGAQLIGVAPNVTLLPVKAFSPYGETTSGALYSSIEFAVNNGAKVIVLGWASSRPSRALESALRLAAENNVLVVAAAGEGGQNLDSTPYYPAAYKALYPDQMVVVSGYDQKGALTWEPGHYANHGNPVDLLAPGSQVRVAHPRDNYATVSHTGIAAGFVGGAAAYLFSVCPNATPKEVKEALLAGARTLGSFDGQLTGNKALSLQASVDYISQVCK